MRRRSSLRPGGFGLEIAAVPQPATSRSLFGNQKPLELEIGSGKGTFLLSESGRRPHVNFLGIENQRRYWRYASDRLRRHGSENARLVLADAATFLRDYVEDGSLAAVHLYFPDPWPKRRHHKRRFVQPTRVELVKKKLAPNGRLWIVTDHTGYFDHIQQVLTRSTLRIVPFETPAAAGAGELTGTNFERKYRLEGRPFHAVGAERI